jgi:hypothetical protein
MPKMPFETTPARDRLANKLAGELRTMENDASIGFRMFLRWIIASLIDGAFLTIWTFTQYGVDQAIGLVELSSIDNWMLLCFQVLFAISTLAPVVLYICQDISIMFIRTMRAIRQERERDILRKASN